MFCYTQIIYNVHTYLVASYNARIPIITVIATPIWVCVNHMPSHTHCVCIAIVEIIGPTTINSDIWKQFLAIDVGPTRYSFFCIFVIVNQYFDECKSGIFERFYSIQTL